MKSTRAGILVRLVLHLAARCVSSSSLAGSVAREVQTNQATEVFRRHAYMIDLAEAVVQSQLTPALPLCTCCLPRGMCTGLGHPSANSKLWCDVDLTGATGSGSFVAKIGRAQPATATRSRSTADGFQLTLNGTMHEV